MDSFPLATFGEIVGMGQILRSRCSRFFDDVRRCQTPNLGDNLGDLATDLA